MNFFTDFSREIYPRIFMSLKSQRTVIESIATGLESCPATKPYDRAAIETFKSVVGNFLECTYASLFQTNTEASVIVKRAMETPLSTAVEKIGDRILMVCILFNRIKSLMSLVRLRGDGSTSDDDPQFCFSPPGSPDILALSGASGSGGKLPTTVMCRVCEREVPLELIQTHSRNCAIAYQSSQVMKSSDDRIWKLIVDTEHEYLNVPWPGVEENVLEMVLPVWHVIVLLERAAAVDPDSSGAYDEMTEIDDCLRMVQMHRNADLIQFHSQAMVLVDEKLNATERLSAALDITKKTVTKKERKNSGIMSETLISDFQFIDKISSGAYARVFLARKKKTGDIYAIKAIPKDRTIQKNEIQSVITEKDILLRLVSPYMIRFFYSIIGHHNLYIVMEYMPGGDLYSVLEGVGKFSEHHAKIYTVQVVAALEFLRKNNIIHRDLKPDNILVGGDGMLKLADFGLSFYGMVDRAVGPSEPASGRAVGTPDYMAPEIIWQQRHSFSADYWSLGCIIYEFLVGVPPFHEDTPQDTFASIVRGDFDKSELSSFSPEVTDLISRLLVTDASRRLGDKSIDDIKNHPWFEGIDWERISDLKPPFVPKLESPEDTSYFQERYHFTQGDEQDAEILDDIKSSATKKPSRSLSYANDDIIPLPDSDDGISCFPSVSIDSLQDATIESANKLLKQRATSFCGDVDVQALSSNLLESHSFAGRPQQLLNHNFPRRPSRQLPQRRASSRIPPRGPRCLRDSGTRSDEDVT